MPNLDVARVALANAARALGLKSVSDPRDEWERRLQKVLKRVLNGQYDAVVAQLGDPPDLNKLDSTFWAGLGEAARKELQGELERIHIDAGIELAATHSIELVDWALPNAAAAEWAKQYTFDLVQQLEDTSRKKLQEAVPAFFEQQGTTMGDLKAELSPIFGVQRADNIAITEVTRAVSRGEQSTVDEIKRGGIEMEAVWETMEDGEVDDVCRRLDGQVAGPDGMFTDPETGAKFLEPPDPHPGCRCRKRWRIKGQA